MLRNMAGGERVTNSSELEQVRSQLDGLLNSWRAMGNLTPREDARYFALFERKMVLLRQPSSSPERQRLLPLRRSAWMR